MAARALVAFFGMLCIGLVPFVPALLRARIRVLRWFGLDFFARLHESNFEIFVLIVRCLLAGMGMVMLFLAVAAN